MVPFSFFSGVYAGVSRDSRLNSRSSSFDTPFDCMLAADKSLMGLGRGFEWVSPELSSAMGLVGCELSKRNFLGSFPKHNAPELTSKSLREVGDLDAGLGGTFEKR